MEGRGEGYAVVQVLQQQIKQLVVQFLAALQLTLTPPLDSHVHHHIHLGIHQLRVLRNPLQRVAQQLVLHLQHAHFLLTRLRLLRERLVRLHVTHPRLRVGGMRVHRRHAGLQQLLVDLQAAEHLVVGGERGEGNEARSEAMLEMERNRVAVSVLAEDRFV